MTTAQGYQALLHKQQANQYKEQQVRTASKEQLLIMLYDGAIRFCRVGKKAMQENNFEKSNENLLKAQRILTEFMASLDVETGGEVAQNLLQLYEYLHYRLVQANIKKNTEMIDEVSEHLRDLRETWVKAIEIAHQEQQQNGGGAEKALAQTPPPKA